MATPVHTLQALDDYRAAIRTTKFWEDNGTHGDGNLKNATAIEKKRRADFLKTMQSWKDADSLNEADIDVKANELLGYGVLDYNPDHSASTLAAAALNGDRAALRKLVKNAIRGNS